MTSSPFTGGLPFWDSHLQSKDDTINEQSLQYLLSPPIASAGMATSAAEGGAVQRSSSSSSSNSSSNSNSNNSNSSNSNGNNNSSSSSSNSSSSNSSKGPDIFSGYPPPIPSTLSLEERIARCLSVAEECIQEDELAKLLEKKQFPIAYDGFEPSGRMHIAQGLLKVKNVNKLTSAGCIFVFWVADWFAMLNNKMGGDLKKIRKVGEYFIEVWKSAGMKMDNVRFLWASEEIGKAPEVYWQLVMNIAKANSISRVKRCSQIMGRAEGDDQPSAQIMYPCMQCADIFYLNADICQLGMDQRKVNVLAREYCDYIKKKNKQVILSHHMLPGLLEGQDKMSKSNTDSAIFMEDSEAEVNRKIKKAFCPPCIIEGNPCISYAEYLVYPDEYLVIERTEENGGNVVYNTINELKYAYTQGQLHPADLKNSLAKFINYKLTPIRQHFMHNEYAKQLLKQISSYKITK